MFGAEEHEEHQTDHEQMTTQPRSRNVTLWITAASVCIFVAGMVALASSHRQQTTVDQLTAREGDMTAKIASLQDELNTATQKLNEMTAEQAAEEQRAEAAAQAAQAAHQVARASAVKRAPRRAVVDPRWKQVQSRLDAEQKELDETTNTLNQTRSDLEGTINSTRDELGGSIAKNHAELVTLEQRGERNYYEFDISKSKRFERTGPIELSLRKADAKHEHYNLALMVDDNEIQKKNVDLYEPIWLRDSDDTQPLEIVVNKIDKDHIHGYVSSSKYTQAQLTPAAASGNTGAAQTPAASSSPAAPSNPQSN